VRSSLANTFRLQPYRWQAYSHCGPRPRREKSAAKILSNVDAIMLAAWTVRMIKSFRWADGAGCPTDYEKIVAEAQAAGLTALFRCPKANLETESATQMF
jgi:hypothetical protein